MSCKQVPRKDFSNEQYVRELKGESLYINSNYLARSKECCDKCIKYIIPRHYNNHNNVLSQVSDNHISWVNHYVKCRKGTCPLRICQFRKKEYKQNCGPASFP